MVGWFKWVRALVGWSVTLYLVDTLATSVFAQSLSKFTCKFWMMRGGTLLILGHGSKVKVNFGALCIRPCGQDTDYSFCRITFNRHIKLWMMRGGTLLILRYGVKGQGQLWHSVHKAIGQDSVYVQSLSKFTSSYG